MKAIWILLLALTVLGVNKASADAFSEAIREYPVVMYVNKSTAGKMAQKLVLFVEGKKALTAVVSTGREQYEADRLSETPVGFYTPQALVRDHVASQSGIEMPYSIFFNKGIALHQAVDAGLYRLGNRASSGCVRLSRETAPKIYSLVENYGRGSVPVFDVQGRVQVDENDQLVKSHRYMTLIIVDNSKKDSPDLLNQISKSFGL